MRQLRRVVELTVSVAACLAASGAEAQSPNYVEGKQRWLAARYPQALPPLETFRREPYGRNAEVDYMLGTSACRVQSRRTWGARVLNFAIYAYPLTSRSRATLVAERDRCRSTAPLGPLPSAATTQVEMATVAGATARGKLFNFGDRSIAAYPARRTRELTREELNSRLVPVGNAQQISAVVGALAPQGARVQVVGHFVFATTAGQNEAELSRMGAQLNRYLKFLETEYSLRAPQQYLTFYLLPDVGEVQKVADRVHGLDVSPSTLGYSFQDDLSAAAMIHGTQSGTLMHELFHLLVRSSFGDIPQWLDEGMASLYEVSAEQANGRYVGLPNWRGRVLRQGEEFRPALADVIASPWFDFDRAGADVPAYVMPDERAAVHLATARYFTLYLQERGMLAQLFRSLRNRDPGAAEDPGQATVALVEAKIGPMKTAQPSYDAWLPTVLDQDETNAPSTPGRTLPGKTLPTANR